MNLLGIVPEIVESSLSCDAMDVDVFLTKGSSLKQDGEWLVLV